MSASVRLHARLTCNETETQSHFASRGLYFAKFFTSRGSLYRRVLYAEGGVYPCTYMNYQPESGGFVEIIYFRVNVRVNRVIRVESHLLFAHNEYM